MYIIVKDKVIEIIPCRTFIQQVKSLNFIIEPIDYGILIPKKRFINTYMFCQKVDICVTDKEQICVWQYFGVQEGHALRIIQWKGEKTTDIQKTIR